jgi:glycosyltransferase involved in cell wall biosynthesis
MIKVLYDGWTAIYQPNSPSAIHLLTLLEQRRPEVKAVVALPGEPPEWLPGEVKAHILPTENTPGARLAWEQRQLPRIAGSLGAQLLHLTTATPALFSSLPVVLSPAYFPAPKPKGIAARLRVALASGGLTRLDGLFWPVELESSPPQEISSLLFRLPVEPYPQISSGQAHGAAQLAALDLPETYILYHGPCDEAALQRLLAAWGWACGLVGEYYPVFLLGLDDKARQRLPSLAGEYGCQGTLHPLPVLPPRAVFALVQGCSAVFHPAPLAAWGGAARLALAYGKPLVAAETPQAVALAGPAAYLAPADDSRALGAALLTVIVEEQVAQTLGETGLLRAAGWDSRSFGEALFAAYQEVLSQSKISRNGLRAVG